MRILWPYEGARLPQPQSGTAAALPFFFTAPRVFLTVGAGSTCGLMIKTGIGFEWNCRPSPTTPSLRLNRLFQPDWDVPGFPFSLPFPTVGQMEESPGGARRCGTMAQQAVSECMARGLRDSAVSLSEWMLCSSNDALDAVMMLRSPPVPPPFTDPGGPNASLMSQAPTAMLPSSSVIANVQEGLGRALLLDQQLLRSHFASARVPSCLAQFVAWYALYLSGEQECAPQLAPVNVNAGSTATSGPNVATGDIVTPPSMSGATAPEPAGVNGGLLLLGGMATTAPAHPEPVAASGSGAPRRNRHLVAIHTALNHLFTEPLPVLRSFTHERRSEEAERGLYREDPYLLWLSGLVHRGLGRPRQALDAFCDALARQPFLWCAWRDACRLLPSEAHVDAVLSELLNCGMPPRLAQVYDAIARSELQNFTSAAQKWQRVLDENSCSSSVSRSCAATFGIGADVLPRTELASACYHRKDFDRARGLFADVSKTDPCRLDRLDEYSNLLFVINDRVTLSALAQRCHEVDPLRAETNCVAGNYYALLRRHAHSLACFRRAAVLDPYCASAWTLMGHEWMEVRNTAAAVEAYRCALRIDPRDYRAWYGLGQIYELLQLFHYALHYFWHTTALRPFDARMWMAVAGCLEKQQRPAEAIACLERAETCEPSESDTYAPLVHRIAAHYHSVPGSEDKAQQYWSKLLACPHTTEQQISLSLASLAGIAVASAQALLDMPARSPSFEPGMSAAGSGRASDPNRHVTTTDARPRLSGLMRQQHASSALEQATAYMDRLAQLQAVVGQSAAAPAVVDAETVASLRREIEHTRHFLTSSAPAGAQEDVDVAAD